MMKNETKIDSLMDAVQTALMTANFESLQSLTPELDAALAELGPSTGRKALTHLQAKAKRNAASALAAGKGVRAAIQRLEEVRKNAEGLVTYDESGKRPGPSGGSELSRRL